jgi:hypothetical protein
MLPLIPDRGAMAVTKGARVSERIGRAYCGNVPSGRIISRLTLSSAKAPGGRDRRRPSERRVRKSGKLDYELFWLDLDARNILPDEARVIDPLQRSEMLPH